jgi:tol-pal system protein YbgF
VRSSLRLAWVPAVALAAGACLATHNDVLTLQGDIAVLRAQAARADSAHRVQLQHAAQQVGAVGDSLRSLNAFLQRFSAEVSRFQGDVSLALHSFGQQLIAVQERTGQSQKTIQQLRADLETVAPAPAAATPATGAPASTGAIATPSGSGGPQALILSANSQLFKGSLVTARAGFQEFLDKYPTHELAPEAYYGIGQAWDAERQFAAADSAYQIVVDKYPKSDRAPSALYKRAMIQRQAGQAAKARALFQQLVDRYPGAPEAELAKDYLKPPA